MEASTLIAPERVVSGTGVPLPLKVVVLGGRAVGQARVDVEDAFVTAVSDLPPDAAAPPVLPYGRCAVTERLDVHLYGMPEQRRFWYMWDELSRGSVAALVLADARRLADSFSSIDYATDRGLPFLVAVANADGYPLPEVREALAVPADVPVLLTDAVADPGRPRPARELLQALVRYAVAHRHSRVPAA